MTTWRRCAATRGATRPLPGSPAAAGRWTCSPAGCPARRISDRAVPDRPVFLANRDHHAAWVNSRAFALAGVDAQHPGPGRRADRAERAGRAVGHPAGGRDGPDGTGRPAPAAWTSRWPESAKAQRYLHALGITGWQEAIVGDYAVIPDCFDAYLEAERRGLLTARVVGALWWQRETGIGQLDGLAERRDRAERAGPEAGASARPA